jgi:non-specific serine/threonine protein kinase
MANSQSAGHLQHFYIPEEQSVYLLSHKDAKKLKDWIGLCTTELTKLGYDEIQLVGKGAYGFAFSGKKSNGREYVFKFSRITLPKHIRDRLEEEAYMLSHVKQNLVPQLIEFQFVGKQAIMVMERAKGIDLEQLSLQKGPLPIKTLLNITAQLVDVVGFLRLLQRPVVHGDIKPSNIVYDEKSGKIGLIDWGSSVFAQHDEHGEPIDNDVMNIMSNDLQNTNAKFGDIYFIGHEQLTGSLSSPRFDEQGLASTIYALASGQSCRFGHNVIRPASLGLPIELAKTLEGMMDINLETQRAAGNYLMRNIHHIKRIKTDDVVLFQQQPLVSFRAIAKTKEVDTVVYSSRKSFLREESSGATLKYMNDAQFARYYKNYLSGMGDIEKAFIAAVSRLGRYPVVGGLVIQWGDDNLSVDSSLSLYDKSLQRAFQSSINNVVTLARGIKRKGIFKSCMFDARNTIHVERETENAPFSPAAEVKIPFELSDISVPVEQQSKTHSYFEDGDDPDELLRLPKNCIDLIHNLNTIHHTGCIIFEALPNHLKIHSNYTLLDHNEIKRFTQILQQIIDAVPSIQGEGISGFMKLPFKETRAFSFMDELPEHYYPKNSKIVN